MSKPAPSFLDPKRKDPSAYGARCDLCPFAKDKRPHLPVWGERPANPIGLVVGESPGREETEQARPFVGQTGQALDEELMHAGLLRSKLVMVNAICCQPKAPKKESEMRMAAQCCHPAFMAQLTGLPVGIHTIALGKWAGYALTGRDKGAMKGRGFINEKWNLNSIPWLEPDLTGTTQK